MNPLWLPATQLRYGRAKDFKAGTLVFSQNGNVAEPIEVGIRVDRATEADGDQALVLALTAGWFQGRLPAGDLATASDRFECMALSLVTDQTLSLEVDAAVSGPYPEEGGSVSWYRDGARLSGYYGRHGNPYSAGIMNIDPVSWQVWLPPTNDRGPVMHSAGWRLCLRLSPTEVVIVAKSAPAA